MPSPTAPRATLIFLLAIATSSAIVRPQTAPALRAQSTDDSAAERAKAATLAQQQKWLDALPLFEDLYAKNPNDTFVLEGLAQSLVDRSATQQDPIAAGQDVLRAKSLLEKAQQLGDRSQLLDNLLQSLNAAPANGQIRFSENPEVNAAMKAGESAFAQQNYDDAIKNYSQALALDPTSYGAALFIGDSYFAQKKYQDAGTWYDRAAQLNPNSETAYRYHADMLIKQSDFAAARALCIEAIVAEPYNAVPWRELDAWSAASHTPIAHPRVETGASSLPNGQFKVIVDPSDPPDIAEVWLAYSAKRTDWYSERFQEEFPHETLYRHSLREESEALNAAAAIAEEVVSESPRGPAAKNPNIQLLLRISRAHMIEPYLLLSAADAGLAQDYPKYRENNRPKLESYLSDFVVPEPAKAP